MSTGIRGTQIRRGSGLKFHPLTANLQASFDGTTIEAETVGYPTASDGGPLRVKDLGISTAKLAAGAATLAKLGALSSKGAVITFDGTNHVQQAVGTNGQVLTADSTLTNGVKWATPAVYVSPLTTKGDLFTFTTLDARLGVGAAGTHLVADSSQATGLKWDPIVTSAAGAGVVWTLGTGVALRLYKTGGAVAQSGLEELNSGLTGLKCRVDAVTIDINLANNTLTVPDNGIGSAKLNLFSSKGSILSYTGSANTVLTLPTASRDAGHALITDSTATSGLRWNPLAGGGRNKVINGSMAVWQRGTSFVTPATNAYFADRWYCQFVNSGTITVAQTAGPVAVSASPTEVYANALKVTCTAADAAVAAGDHLIINQVVEGYNFAGLKDQPVNLSFWVRASATGTYYVGLCDSGGTRSYVASYTISAANTWEKKSIQVVIDTSAGTWDYTNGVGLRLRWALMAGTTYHTAPSAWAAGNFLANAGITNFMATLNGTWELTGVQLEKGFASTEFEHRQYADELALCYRYYEKTQDISNVVVTVVAGRFPAFPYKATKRGTPTVTASFTGGVGATFTIGREGFYQNTNHSVDSGFTYVADAELT